MATYVWATDTHLDALGDDRAALIDFGQRLTRDNPTGVILTGDISTSRKLLYHLMALEQLVRRPIYFVLGNHDYYDASIDAVRQAVHELSNSNQFLRYLPTIPCVTIAPGTALVGADGWYDAIHGDWQGSSMRLTDWKAIQDFRLISNVLPSIVAECRKLAHASVTHVQDGIKAAVKYHRHVVIATHVPPFAQACVYRGAPSDAGALPWYSSKLMGDLLLQAAAAYPAVRFTVLAGHTHGEVTHQVVPNLTVRVGGADYGKPTPQPGLIEAL